MNAASDRSPPSARDPDHLLKRYRKAKERRSTWESHWQECYDYALPLRDAVINPPVPGEKKGERLFDATAADAVDQLAARLLRLLLLRLLLLQHALLQHARQQLPHAGARLREGHAARSSSRGQLHEARPGGQAGVPGGV